MDDEKFGGVESNANATADTSKEAVPAASKRKAAAAKKAAAKVESNSGQEDYQIQSTFGRIRVKCQFLSC
jgi:hypothetical protein